MFYPIINYYQWAGDLSPEEAHNLRIISDHYESITPSTKTTLSQIRDKYSHLNGDPLTTDAAFASRLEFWRGSGQFELCLYHKHSGVLPHEEFGWFIKEWSDEHIIDIQNFDHLKRYYRIWENIFYSWISYLWQDINGMRPWVNAVMIENNSARTYSLNDFAWEELSNYIYSNTNYPTTGKFFTRGLRIEEIYSRVDLRYDYRKTPSYQRKFTKDGIVKQLMLDGTNIFIEYSGIKQDTEILYTEPLDSRDKQKLFMDTINELTNQNWIDSTYVIGRGGEGKG
jgi:hypothetical protein